MLEKNKKEVFVSYSYVYVQGHASSAESKLAIKSTFWTYCKKISVKKAILKFKVEKQKEKGRRVDVITFMGL